MGSDFDSFDQSGLGAFIESQLGQRGFDEQAATGLVNLLYFSGQSSFPSYYNSADDSFDFLDKDNQSRAHYYDQLSFRRFSWCVHNGVLVVSVLYDQTSTYGISGSVYYYNSTLKQWVDISGGFFETSSDAGNSIAGSLHSINDVLICIGQYFIARLPVSDLTTLTPTQYDVVFDEATDLFTISSNPYVDDDIVRVNFLGGTPSGNGVIVNTTPHRIDNVSGDDFELHRFLTKGTLSTEVSCQILIQDLVSSWDITWYGSATIFSSAITVGNSVYVAGSFSSLQDEFSSPTTTISFISNSWNRHLIEVDSDGNFTNCGANTDVDSTVAPLEVIKAESGGVLVSRLNNAGTYGSSDSDQAGWLWNGSSWSKHLNYTAAGVLPWNGFSNFKNKSIHYFNSKYYFINFSDKDLYSISGSTATLEVGSVTIESMDIDELGSGNLIIAYTLTTADDSAVSSFVHSYDGTTRTAIGTGGGTNFLYDEIVSLNESVSIDVYELTLPTFNVTAQPDNYGIYNNTGDTITLSGSIDSDPDSLLDYGNYRYTLRSSIDGDLEVSSTFSFSLDTDDLTNDDQHSITVEVDDKFGAGYFPIGVTISLGNAVPTSSISAPSSGATVDGTAGFTVTGSAVDATDGDISSNILWYLYDSSFIAGGATFLEFLGTFSSSSVTPTTTGSVYLVARITNSQFHFHYFEIPITIT